MILVQLMMVCGAASQQDTLHPVWPSAPDRPRIRHLQTISSLESLSPKKSFFGKLLGFLTGSEQSRQWLVQPVGITVSSDGYRMIIADPGANGIHIIDTKDQSYDFLYETKFGRFIAPVDVAFDDDGKLYVSDSQRGEIVVLDDDLDGDHIIDVASGRPTGIDLEGDRMYVTATANHQIMVYDREGTLQSTYGKRGNGEGEFNYPIQLANAPAEKAMFVLDGLNYRIQKFTEPWKFSGAFGTQGNVTGRFAAPKGLAIDSDGNVYITDALMDNLQIFDQHGRLLLVVGHPGSRNGEFLSPGGIHITRDDKIYIVETLNKRIQIFQYLK